jgi:transposase
MTEQRTLYTAEFKWEAVRLITEQRYGVAETARNLGMNVTMLRRWPQHYTANPPAAGPGSTSPTPRRGPAVMDGAGYFKKAMRFFGNASSGGLPLGPSPKT